MLEQKVSLASNGVVKVPGYEQLVRFGYTKNRGVYRLAVTASGEWEGLTVRCFWHTPGGKDPPSSMVVGGFVDVPASVTAQSGNGCITFEGSDGAKTVTSADLRYRVSANSGTEGGTEPEPGTPAWQQLVEVVHTNATAAEQARKGAETAATRSESAANRAENAQQKTEEARTDALDKISTAKADALKAVDAKQTAATAAVESTSKKALDAVTAAQGTAVKAVSDAQSTATQAVQTAQTDAVSAVEKAGSGVLASIPEDYKTTVQKVEDLKTEKAEIDDSTVGLDAWSSKHIVDMLCPPLEETGNPVVCYPVAGYPLGVKVSWKPTQAGEGEPYPAGGGAQLLDISRCTAIYGKPYGLTITIDGDIIKCSGVPSAEVTSTMQYSFAVASSAQEELRGKGYKVTAWPIKGKVSNAWGLRTADESSLAIAAELSPGVDTDIQLRLMVSKDTPTSYAPYENIRPISGREAVTVERCGENLLHIKPFNKGTYKGITYEYVPDGGIHISGTATAAVDSPTFAVWHLPPGKYHGLDMDAGVFASIVVHRNGANLWLNAKGAFEILTGDVIKYWYMGVANGTTIDKTVYPYIVPGTSATTYAPYTGQTSTLTFPTTIYGGEVEATTGEGQETWKLLTLDGTEKWDAVGSGDNLYFRSILISIGPRMMSSDDYCTTFPIVSISDANTAQGVNGWNTSLYLRWPTFADVDALKSYLAAQYAAGTPVQVCYKLAEPISFTAIGAQPIPALSGVNTVLTDADSATVTGRADPIKRITDLEDAVASMT